MSKFISKKLLKSDMRKLMKCMNYTIKKAETKNSNPIYSDIYQLLGGYAWAHICDYCDHEYKISKKYPTGHCVICGKVKN